MKQSYRTFHGVARIMQTKQSKSRDPQISQIIIDSVRAQHAAPLQKQPFLTCVLGALCGRNRMVAVILIRIDPCASVVEKKIWIPAYRLRE